MPLPSSRRLRLPRKDPFVLFSRLFFLMLAAACSPCRAAAAFAAARLTQPAALPAEYAPTRHRRQATRYAHATCRDALLMPP